ncbi:hypothetical protein FNH22_17330 [Fulvivirga sp. M361]|uniref:PKD domain-containing protein n=1 Tax=Fulvivirga sp. M361 TaxID=2594266 RepID=UPI001179CFF1|nr:PKD domain-containing protein [Fulvivirga sp. M361]TRX56140.1 hypothetical protein FNH22_17330 [Fulvivirga sp. M361]
MNKYLQTYLWTKFIQVRIAVMLAVWACFVPVFSAFAQEGNVPDAIEYQALMDLYNSTGGLNWTNNTNWLTGTANANFGTWFGVTVVNGDVQRIILPSNNLTNILPSSLILLSQLKELTLNNNSLAGNIPSFIGQLNLLEELNLSQNNFSGLIPSELGDLSNLKELALIFNGLSGSIPPELGNLLNLERLLLFTNELSGTLPASLGNLINLQQLDLNNNNFISPIPNELSNLSNLNFLRLSGNNFEGSFSLNLNNFAGLTSFFVQRNKFNNLPNLSSHINALNLSVAYSVNQVDFGSLEPNFTNIGTYPFLNFTYSPQAEIGEEQNLTFHIGSPFNIPFTTGGTRNQYQWQKKDASNQWHNIPGATSSSFSKASFEVIDIGEYRVVVTNEWVTNLTLYSKIISVQSENDCVSASVTQNPTCHAAGNGEITIDISCTESPFLLEFFLFQGTSEVPIANITNTSDQQIILSKNINVSTGEVIYFHGFDDFGIRANDDPELVAGVGANSEYRFRLYSMSSDLRYTSPAFVLTAPPLVGSYAGPDQTVCSPTATMAATGTSGHWTQETGPSPARFSNSTSPGSIVTLGSPGEYVFTWTVPGQNCNGTDQVFIDYEPNLAVSILPADGRPVTELTRGRFYDHNGGVDSGVNYPLNGGVFYDGLAVDTKGNTLYVAADAQGLWILDRNTNHGELITVDTAVPSGDKYNQYTRSLFVDEDARVLYASGWPRGTNAGALWRYDLVTGEGTAFYPGYLPPGGGDPFPNGIGDEVKRIGDKVYVSVYRFNGNIPDGGVYIYDESDRSGKFLTPENTTPGGAYTVQGDPMPSNKCHTTAYTLHKGKEYLFVGFQDNEIWEFNLTDNIGRVFTPVSTAPDGDYSVDGDPMPDTDVFNLKLAGSLLMSVNWKLGVWLFDFNSNQGKLLTRENTLPGGRYEVIGDAIPTNHAGGLEYDPEGHRIFVGLSSSQDPELANVQGTGGGIWEYGLATGRARLHKVADVGYVFEEFTVRPVRFDPLSRTVYGSIGTTRPGAGIFMYDLRDGVTICNGETVTLRANVNGNPGVTYQWRENGVPIAAAINSTYSTATPGYYTVTASLSGGCYTESEGFIVREARFDNLSVTPNSAWEICDGGSTVINATAGYIGYQWYRGTEALAEAITNQLTVSSNEPGIYTVQATTIEGCTGNAVDSVSITASTLSLSYVSLFDSPLGRGSIDLTVSGGVAPYTYEWSDGLVGQEDHMNTLLPGVYSVEVTDVAGCTAASGPIVIGLDHCSFSLSANVMRDDGSASGTIDLNVLGGIGPFTYSWTLGLPAQQDQTGLRKGVYRVSVTDSQGCSQRLSVVVRGSDECQNVTSYHSFAFNTPCHDTRNGLIIFAVLDGVPPYDYSIFDVLEEREVTQEVNIVPFSQNMVLFTGLKPSEYVVSVRNQECEFFDIIDTGGLVVGSPELIVATFNTKGDTGSGNGSIDLTVTGGTAPYSYAWSGSLPAVEDHNGIVSTGVYEVTVTDALGCQVIVEDIFVENANNCSPDHPQRFTVQLLSATERACDDGSTTADMTVRLDFANAPPFPGMTYTFRLMDATGFNYFENNGGTILQEFAGVTINTDPFDFSFTGIAVVPTGYGVVVMADGVTPAQHPTCLYGTYGFANNITIGTDPLPDASFRFRYPLIKVGDEVETTIEEFVSGYSYTFNWNDGTATVASHQRSKRLFDTPGEYNVTLTVVSDQGCISQTTEVLRVFDYICESPVPDNGGQFYVDNTTGKIVFRRAECPGNFLLSCISATAQPNIFDNAVAASAVTYDDQWDHDPLQEASHDFDESANAFERGERGKWRIKNFYAFKVPLQESDKNFSAGTFRLEDFSWRYEDANDPSKWIRSTTVERYSPNGEALQERNALGVPSAAKFGYQGALPYLIAQNAEYQDVHFESFERIYRNRLEDNVSISDNGIAVAGDIVHAGTKSARLNGMFKLPVMHLSDQLVSNGLLMKVWIHAPQATQLTDLYFSVVDKNGVIVSSSAFDIVATVGPWQLLEAMVTNFGTLVVGDFRENSDVLIPALENRGTDPVWIDDLRYQPADAEMTTYLYDPRNFRLLTVFDDQHFGLYYQYNAEGKLVRKRIETERGIKTIQETQINQPKVSRGE